MVWFPPSSVEDRSGGTDGRCRVGFVALSTVPCRTLVRFEPEGFQLDGWDVTEVVVQPVVVVPVHPTQRGQLNLIDDLPRTAALRGPRISSVYLRSTGACGSVRPRCPEDRCGLPQGRSSPDMHAPTQLHVAGGVTRNLIPTKSGALSVAAEFGSSPRGGATYRIKSATRRRPLSVAVGSCSAPRMWTPTWSAPASR